MWSSDKFTGLRFAVRFTAAETPVGYYHCVHKVEKKTPKSTDFFMSNINI